MTRPAPIAQPEGHQSAGKRLKQKQRQSRSDALVRRHGNAGNKHGGAK